MTEEVLKKITDKCPARQVRTLKPLEGRDFMLIAYENLNLNNSNLTILKQLATDRNS